MQIGFPNHPRRDVLAEIRWIAANGFDFVDLFLEPDKAAIEAIDPPAIRRELDRAGLGAVGHLAYYLPIGSPLPQLRRAAVATATEYLGAFRAMAVTAVTVHAHWPPRFFADDEGVEWQVESLSELVRRGNELGVRLLYEPIDRPQDTPENLQRVLERVPELLCHLDTGHCNLCGRSPAGMIRRFGSRLGHLHVSDNDGLVDLHLPPGTGTIDWQAVFAAIRSVGYDNTLTLEVFSRDRDYVLLCKEKIRALCERS